MSKIQSVTGIVRNTKGVLLLKRKDTDLTYTGYCLVGGKVDIGETLEQALIREVREEIGLQVTNSRLYQTHENEKFIIHFYFIEVDDETIQLNEEEFDDYGYFPLHRLPAETLPITRKVLTGLIF